MRDVRGLFASLGTSALLITAAVVSLLSFSAVFALGGFEGAQAAGSRETLVLDLQERGGSERAADAARTPAVLVADRVSARSAGKARSSARLARARRGEDAAASSAATSSQIGLSDDEPTASGPPAAPAARPPPPAAATANLGDGVQKLGDDLSSTLQQTGSALGDAVAPLGPQVSVAVQQIVNLVAALVQQTTNGLGSLLGGQPRK